MQATEFLESLIVERQKRDAEWVELKWNSVTKQMWEEFQLSKADIEELKDHMKKHKKGFVLWGHYLNMQYAGEKDVCGWDMDRYMDSVDYTFERINKLLDS